MLLEKFFPEVSLAVRAADPGVPDSLIAAALASSAKEFAERAKVLTRDVSLDLQECVREYYLPPCLDGLQVFEIAALDVNCQPYRTRPGSDTPNHRQCATGETAVFTPETQGLFLDILPQCDVPDGIKIRAVVAPSGEPCATLPDILYTRHKRAVQAGAIRDILFALAPKGGDKWGYIFEELISQAVVRRITGYGAAPARITARDFIAR